MSSNYHFDPESLSYDKVDANKRKKFFKSLITQIIAAFVIAVILFIAFSYTFKSAKQKKLEREHKKLVEQYEILYNRFSQTENVMKDLKERDRNIYRAIFETEPPKDIDSLDAYYFIENFEKDALKKKINNSLNQTVEKLAKEERTIKELIAILEGKGVDLMSIPSIQPVKNKNLELIPYGFGKRIDPVYKTPTFHEGIDFASPKGTKIFATASGIVSYAGEQRTLGKNIKINHGNDFETIYAHLSEYTVYRGQKIKKGQVIGFVGNTGKSLVSHIHYQINYKNEPVNPVHFFFQDLTPEQYSLMLKMASRGGLSLD